MIPGVRINEGDGVVNGAVRVTGGSDITVRSPARTGDSRAGFDPSTYISPACRLDPVREQATFYRIHVQHRQTPIVREQGVSDGIGYSSQNEKNGNIFLKSVINMGTKIYNTLPRFLKQIDDHRAFRKKLKLFLLLPSLCSVEEFVFTWDVIMMYDGYSVYNTLDETVVHYIC
jgi:hypothetical protein